MQYRLLYGELQRKLQLKNLDNNLPSLPLLKAYIDLLLSCFYLGRGLLLAILNRHSSQKCPLSAYVLYDPVGFIVHQTKIDHFILSSITLLILFSVIYQVAFIRADKRALVWQLLEDILIRSADLYRSVEVPHLKSKVITHQNIIQDQPQEKGKQLVNISPLALLVIRIQERILPPSIRLQHCKLTEFALSERRKFRLFPQLKSRTKYYLISALSLLELEFFILVVPFILIAFVMLWVIFFHICHHFPVYSYPLLVLDFALLLYTLFILYGPVSFTFIFFLVAYNTTFLFSFWEINRRLRRMLLKGQSLNCSTFFASFSSIHNRLVFYLLQSNRELLAGMFFAGTLCLPPVNILWVDLFYFNRNHMTGVIQVLLFCAIFAQVFAGAFIFIPSLLIPGAVHQSAKALPRVQIAAAPVGRGHLHCKLRLMAFYEAVNVEKRVNISVGPLATFSSRLLAEFLTSYCTYLMLAASFINAEK